jgi:hypothetical protein
MEDIITLPQDNEVLPIYTELPMEFPAQSQELPVELPVELPTQSQELPMEQLELPVSNTTFVKSPKKLRINHPKKCFVDNYNRCIQHYRVDNSGDIVDAITGEFISKDIYHAGVYSGKPRI